MPSTEIAERLALLEDEAMQHRDSAVRFLELLKVIHDERLYRETHSSWETYLNERFDISKAKARRLMLQAADADAENAKPQVNAGRARPVSPTPGDLDRKQRSQRELEKARAAANKAAAAPDLPPVIDAASTEIKKNDDHKVDSSAEPPPSALAPASATSAPAAPKFSSIQLTNTRSSSRRQRRLWTCRLRSG